MLGVFRRAKREFPILTCIFIGLEIPGYIMRKFASNTWNFVLAKSPNTHIDWKITKRLWKIMYE